MTPELNKEGPINPLRRGTYVAPLAVFVVMLASTFGAFVLLHEGYYGALNSYLGGSLVTTFLVTGILICVGVLAYTANFARSYAKLVESLNQSRELIRQQNESLSKRNVSLESEEQSRATQAIHDVEQLQQSRTAMVSLLEDLTTSNEQIKQSQAYESAIFASIVDGAIATDRNGRVVQINESGKQLLGVQEETVLGRPITDVVLLTDEAGTPIPLAQRPYSVALKERRVTRSNAYYLQRSDGRRFPASLETAPILFNDQVLGIVDVFRDITEEQRLDRAKTEFVSLASHQLRTPLTAIGWYAELLSEQKDLSDQTREYVTEIFDANKRMVGLVDSLLNVSRIEAGSISVEPKPLDLEKFIRDSFEVFAPLLRERNITVVDDLAKMPAFNGDEKLLTIIVQNLLSNAIKYSKLNGTVRVVLRMDGDRCVIEVADEGLGIPAAQQAKVFTKLFRADNVQAEETTGSGLGLYLVKSIMDQIGGTITFTSVEGKGTTFTVTFPPGGMQAQEGARPVMP